MPKHIAIDARLINSTTGRYMERLVTYLQDIDTVNRYSIIVPSKDVNYWKPRNENFTVIPVDFPIYSLSEQLGFKTFLNQLKPDLVHFCMPQQPLGYKGKKVTTMHDLTLLKTYNSDKNWFVYHAKQKIGKYVFRRVVEENDHMIAITKFTEQETLSTFPTAKKENFTVIYESADTNLIAPKKYDSPFKKYILYVGQQSDYKNVKRLGDAHQLLLAKYPDLGLILAGKKNAATEKNEQYFTSRGYKNIHFTGFVEDPQLSWLYSHAEAYVFPSLMEGFGLPGLEAMTYGTPVVSSNATCLPEVYGQAAHYFNPYDSSDIAQAIDQVLSDDRLRTRLAKAGFKQIKKYSWKKMAQETHKIYMRVLEDKN